MCQTESMIDVIMFAQLNSEFVIAKEVVLKTSKGWGDHTTIEANTEAEFEQKLNKWLDFLGVDENGNITKSS